MPVSALVITLAKAPDARQNALETLAADSRFILGEADLDQLPVVLETSGLRDGARLIRDELPAIRGIEFVHVISVDFSDLNTTDLGEGPAPRRPRRHRTTPMTPHGGNR